MPELRPISADLARLAAEELNEDPEKVQSDIDILRNWIDQTPHLKSRTDDQFLVAFLRGCKYSLEKAKQKLDLFYTVRTHAPELIRDRDPHNERIIGMIRLGCVAYVNSISIFPIFILASEFLCQVLIKPKGPALY